MNLTVAKALGVSPDVAAITKLLEAREIELDPQVVAERFVRYLASNSHVDTVGDVMAPGCWDVSEWLANPAMQVDHDTRVKGSVAQGLNASTQPQGLLVDGFFLPADLDPSGMADTMLKMVRAGILTDCSVGFWPKPENSGRMAATDDKKTFGDSARWIWTSVWLKELTICRIGMNAQAKVQAVAKALQNRELTESDALAVQGLDSMRGLFERALFQLHPSKTVQAPETSGEVARLESMISDLAKSVSVQAAATKRMLRMKEMGAGVYMELDSLQALAEHCESMAEHCDCVRAIITDAIPTDPNGGSQAPVDPIPTDPTKSQEGAETKSALDRILKGLHELNGKN